MSVRITIEVTGETTAAALEQLADVRYQLTVPATIAAVDNAASPETKAARKRAAKNAEPPAVTPAAPATEHTATPPISETTPQSAPAGSAPDAASSTVSSTVPPAGAPVSSDAAPAISHETLKDAMKAYLQKKGSDADALKGAVALMHKYDATMLSEIPAEHRAALLKDLGA